MSRAVVEELPKRWLTNDEAVRYLGVSKDVLKDMRDRALVHFYKHGKTIWYEVKDLDDYVMKGKVV